VPNYFQFDVSLNNVKPRIWRSFFMVETADFYDLHEAIQLACEWDNYHCFIFCKSKNRGRGGRPERTIVAGIPGDNDYEEIPEASEVPLAQHFSGDIKTCRYTYDFGDCWEHTVKLKKMVSLDETFFQKLVGGKRAFPPEDSGGIWGYRDLITRQQNLDNNEEDYSWHPEQFNFENLKTSFDRELV